MKEHTVTGGGGIELHVEERGNADGRPILFIHGYTQSRRSWTKQLESTLADDFRLVAMDNRGHGQSEKPESAYAESELWADDVQRVIETLELDRPVLVGWSYGGLIISDYLEKYGDEQIAGINLVGAISKNGTDDAMAVIGEEFVELIPGFESTDAEESVNALETFVERCVHGELLPEDRYFMLGYNAVVPPHVREGLHSRTLTHDEDLRAIEKPVLITHGEADTIVLPAAAEEHAELIGTAETSFYPEVGHSPFWEEPERFNRELREFAAGLEGETMT
ncbi:alpha/beta fold hydrolase [Natrinema salsiterrestre]|uniref:Alpha/beta hydrolase n=1 Tax=Natrinema salsiterrestre TaxID=2950540 RepID=A0A9Q4Q410_9EURY|nr:alpha/beta hydrolase [Natrinema salsiterrestre]MDF9746807.1 alpha/beta hydrolase [Natrinema salsiterrestre]